MSSSTPSRPPSPATPGKPAEGTPAHDGGGAAETAVKPQLQAIKPPAMYQVVLINDDYEAATSAGLENDHREGAVPADAAPEAAMQH